MFKTVVLIALSLFCIHENSAEPLPEGSTASTHPLTRTSTLLPLQSLELEPSLFGLQLIRFDSSSKLSIQQEYLYKELQNYPGNYGLLIRNLMLYDTTFSAKENAATTESLSYQALNFRLTKLDREDQLAFQGYYILQNKASEKGLPYFRKFIREVSEKDTSPWLNFIGAMVAETTRRSYPESGLTTTDVDTLINRSAQHKDADAMLLYSMGNYFANFSGQNNPYRRLRLITMSFEKSRSLDPRNRNLFTKITSRYIELQEEFQANSIPQPFEFEELVYRRIVLLDPKNPMARNNLAFLYCQNNVEVQEGLKQAQMANELEPNNPYLLDTLGWCQYRNQMFPEAIKTLKNSLQLNSSLAEVHFHLATTYYDSAQIKEAIQSFENCIAKDPEHALAMNNLAYLYAEQGVDLDKAMELVSKANQLVPDNAAFMDTLGWIHFKKGNFAEAEKALRKSLELAPDATDTLKHLSEVLDKLGKNQEAKEQSDRALLIEKNREKAKIQSAQAAAPRNVPYIMLYRAIISARNAYLEMPNVPKTKEALKIFYDQLMLLAQSQGDTRLIQELIKEMEKPEAPAASAKDPTDEDTQAARNRIYARLYSRLGTIFGEAGLFLRAIEFFEKSKNMWPADLETLNNLAYSYAETGTKLDEALNLIQEVLKTRPDESVFLDTKAWILFKLGRTKEALPILEKLGADPSATEFQIHLEAVKSGRVTTPVKESDPDQHQIQEAFQEAFQEFLLLSEEVLAKEKPLLQEIISSLPVSDLGHLIEESMTHHHDEDSAASEIITTSSLSFFSDDSSLYISLSAPTLRLLLRNFLSLPNMQGQFNLAQFLPMIEPQLPRQVALGLSPLATSSADVLAAIELNRAQLETMRENLYVLNGKEIKAPWTQDSVYLSEHSSDVFTFETRGVKVYLTLKDNFLLVSGNPSCLLAPQKNLTQNSGLNSWMATHKQTESDAFFYTPDLKSLSQKISSVSTDLFRNTDTLHKTGRYFSSISLEGEGMREIEYFEPVGSIQDLKAALQQEVSQARSVDTTLELQINLSEIGQEGVQIESKIKQIDWLIRELLKKLQPEGQK